MQSPFHDRFVSEIIDMMINDPGGYLEIQNLFSLATQKDFRRAAYMSRDAKAKVSK